MRQKKFDGKSLQSPALLSLTILNTRISLKHRSFPLQKFSALWDKKFSTEDLDTRPPPSLSINFFTSENFREYSTEGLLYEILGNCETKQFWWKNVITAPSLILYIFRYQKFSETKKGSLTKFSSLWDKNFSTRKIDSPHSFLLISFFTSGIILNHSKERFIYEMLRYCETKQNRRKILIPSRFIQ